MAEKTVPEQAVELGGLLGDLMATLESLACDAGPYAGCLTPRGKRLLSAARESLIPRVAAALDVPEAAYRALAADAVDAVDRASAPQN